MSDPRSLGSLLASDLERYYYYYGQAGRPVRRRDLWRNLLIPRCAPVGWYRLAHAAHRNGRTGIAKLLTWLNFYLYGVEISSACEIGPHFFMPHASGTVIGANRIGAYAVIYHQVTLGAKEVEPAHDQRPVVGDRTFIASGARIIGPIVLGDDVAVGANAVVTKSCGNAVTLVGIPAQERPRALTDARG
ncbi:serine O-acetyltransferase [Tsuneonella amylolytica]|uniref:serine O-acetyltransferase n=1 Tax=Tsuneonella amylolytica TaxID=2338327 RepID=UPI0013C4DB5C|nr:serine acetyltransferase [Tsuneonella amylolytica]